MTELAPGTRLASFRVESVLGRGGMGVVYRAEDGATGRPVALKVIQGAVDATAAARFRREAQAGAAVAHPNVAVVHGAGEEQGRLWVALELLGGGSLDDRLKRLGPLPWREAARFGAAIARGLGAIHAAGIVHRDLKPANVLLDTTGVPKLTDFGLASTPVDGEGRLTRTGELMGTLEFLAPEQAESAKDVGPAADLYALGATLTALLTGRPPFEGSGMALLRRHLFDPPPAPSARAPEVPPSFDGLVLRLLAKDPAARGDAASAATALDAIAKGPGRARRGRAWPIALAFAAALACAGALFARRPAAPPPAAVAPAAPRITIDEPANGARVRGDWTVRGHVDGAAAEVQVNGARVPVVGGKFERVVPLGDARDGTAVVTAGGATARVLVRVDDSVPAWFLAVAPAERPPWPLEGLALAGPGEYRNVKDGSILVFVPGGPCAVSRGKRGATRPPVVEVPSFFIGKYEASQGQFAAFVAATKHETTAESDGGRYLRNGYDIHQDRSIVWTRPYAAAAREAIAEHPVQQVSLDDALAYCAWAGLALPVERQWEKAALWDPRAGFERDLPWGNGTAELARRANLADRSFQNGPRDQRALDLFDHDDGFRHAAPVTAFPDGASAYGALNLFGNASEWCLPDPGAKDGVPVIRGASWTSFKRAETVLRENLEHADVRGRWLRERSFAFMSVGFRVARPCP